MGIDTNAPAYTLDVSSGDAIVRGANNFTTSGNTAHLYVGDTNHAIVAQNGGGIGFSAFQKTQRTLDTDASHGIMARSDRA